MKVLCGEGIASRTDPESCAANAACEDQDPAAEALIDTPCADDAEFVRKLREIMPMCLYENVLPPIGERWARLILTVAAYLEQKRRGA